MERNAALGSDAWLMRDNLGPDKIKFRCRFLPPPRLLRTIIGWLKDRSSISLIRYLLSPRDTDPRRANFLFTFLSQSLRLYEPDLILFFFPFDWIALPPRFFLSFVPFDSLNYLIPCNLARHSTEAFPFSCPLSLDVSLGFSNKRTVCFATLATRGDIFSLFLLSKLSFLFFFRLVWSSLSSLLSYLNTTRFETPGPPHAIHRFLSLILFLTPLIIFCPFN